MTTTSSLALNCSNPTDVFSSSKDLADCFSTHGSPLQFETNGFNDYDIHERSEYWFMGYNVSMNSTFGTVIGSCIDQYCENPDPGLQGCSNFKATPQASSRIIWSGTWNNSGSGLMGFAAPGCTHLNTALNEDFVGPGMIVANVLQYAIILYVWIAIRALPWIFDSTKHFYYGPPEKGSSPSSPIEKKFDRHVSIVKSVLVDYQEAQSFYVLCVQTALRMAISGNSRVLKATSVRQLSLNYDTATWNMLEGVSTVTLGLWMLHKSSLKSTYIILWSVAGILFSGANLYANKQPSWDVFDQGVRYQHLDKCGRKPPPLIYCSAYDDFFTSNSIIYVVVGCFLILGVILIQAAWSHVSANSSIRRSYYRFMETWQSPYQGTVVSMIERAWRVLVEIYLAAIVTYIFVSVCTLVGSSKYRSRFSSTGDDDWSFGQIISAALWIPVAAKYFHWTSFGTESYSETRLSKPFHINQDENCGSSSAEPDKNEFLYHHRLPDSSSELRHIV